MTNPPGSIEIRDLRGQDWVWTHKAILFDKRINGNAYKTYSGLASYANNLTQEAFPSLDTLADILGLTRPTLVTCVGKLEKNGYVHVERRKGVHNIYTLLAVHGLRASLAEKDLSDGKQKVDTPKMQARKFFDGVIDLIDGNEVVWLQEFLREFSDRYSVPKSEVWGQIKAFCGYWTERNHMGTKERWEMQKTFEVDRRLMTWFNRAKVNQRRDSKTRGKDIL